MSEKFVIVVEAQGKSELEQSRSLVQTARTLGQCGSLVTCMKYDDFVEKVRQESGVGIVNLPPMYERKTVVLTDGDDRLAHLPEDLLCEDV